MVTFVAQAIDPDAIEPFVTDWNTWLDGETLASHEVTVTGATLDSDAAAGGEVTATISAATGRRVLIEYRVTSSAGRRDDCTILVPVRSK